MITLLPKKGDLKDIKGLVDVCSRMAASRLQAAKRLLYTAELSWVPVALFFLRKVGNLGCDWQLFGIDFSRLPQVLGAVEGGEVGGSSHKGLFSRTLFFNAIFPESNLKSGLSLHTFARGGLIRLIHLLGLLELARTLAVHSVK